MTRKDESNERLVIKTKHLAVGFLASFLFTMTSTMLYGSNLVFMESAARLEESLVIGLTVPTAQRGTSADDKAGGRRAAVSDASHPYTRTSTIQETINECGNSERWLSSRRYGNLHNDTLFTEELAKSLLLNLDTILIPNTDHMPQILEKSLCHDSSRFRNSSIPESADSRTVRLWAFKLIYLSIHYHQHRLAMPEAKARYGSSSCLDSKSLQQKHGVELFDYECPDAKYIALPLGGNGLGSNVRGGTVLAYLLGLGTFLRVSCCIPLTTIHRSVTNRIVIFVNNAEQGDAFLKTPWSLASCPRQDYQCFFMPTTPCTVTQDELAAAYKLTNKEFRRVMKHGSRLDEVAHHKIWTLNSQFVPIYYFPRPAMQLLQNYAKHLISAVSEIKYPSYVKVLTEAAATITKKDQPRDGYNYAAASYKMHHALTLYSLRPNPESADKLENVMKRIVPQKLRPESSIGLPIRASDKCDWESECLSFDQHMEVASGLWEKNQRNTSAALRKTTPSIVFTTESRSMVEEQQTYASSAPTNSFEFVTNSRDVLPDSGFMKAVAWKAQKNSRDSDPDEIMLSAVSSLQLQLLPKVSIGNCCSNFHTMLNDLLSEGCGAAEENTFVCLQEYEDPRLRVCCGWHQDCKANREKAINELDALLNETTQR